MVFCWRKRLFNFKDRSYLFRRSLAPIVLGGLIQTLGSIGCGLDVVEFNITEQGQVGGAAIVIPGMENFGGSIGKGLSTNGVNPDDVDSMKITGGIFKMTSQSTIVKDLSFLKDLKFEVSANEMSKQLVASKLVFPTGTKEVTLEVTSLEMKPFLDAGNVVVFVSAAYNEFPPEVVQVEVSFTIRVDVNL